MNPEAMQHAKWAVTDANVRSRATVQMFQFLTGALPRIPKTAVEAYSKIVDQNWIFLFFSNLDISNINILERKVMLFHFSHFVCPDMNGKLAQKVDDTLEVVESFREGSSVVGDAATLVELTEIKHTLHIIHRNK